MVFRKEEIAREDRGEVHQERCSRYRNGVGRVQHFSRREQETTIQHESQTMIDPATKAKLRQSRKQTNMVLIAMAIFLVLCGIGFVAKLVLENVGITAMQLASEGKLTVAQIAKVEFLKRKPGDPWPFAQADYDRLPSKRLPATAYPELVRLLSQAEMKRIHGNHPATRSSGILRMTLKDGRQYIVFFDVLQEGDKPYYAMFNALLEGRTSPNLGRAYSFPEEDPTMVEFLRQHNEWVDQELME